MAIDQNFKERGKIQVFLTCHISRAKVSANIYVTEYLPDQLVSSFLKSLRNTLPTLLFGKSSTN